MKAEHRKELETNLLADRMGHLIQRMKGGPQRRSIMYSILIVLGIFVAFVAYRYWQGDPTAVMERWIKLDIGEIGELFNDPDNTNAQKAARFQVAYMRFRNGIRLLASQPVGFKGKNAGGTGFLNGPGGLDYLIESKSVYELLLAECEDDKEWKAEAQYALAVIEETFAGVDPKKLASAKDKYEKVDETSWFGPLAKQRAKDLTDHADKIAKFYKEMDTTFKLADAEKLWRMQAGLKDINPNPMPKAGPN